MKWTTERYDSHKRQFLDKAMIKDHSSTMTMVLLHKRQEKEFSNGGLVSHHTLTSCYLQTDYSSYLEEEQKGIVPSRPRGHYVLHIPSLREPTDVAGYNYINTYCEYPQLPTRDITIRGRKNGGTQLLRVRLFHRGLV